MTFRTLNTMLIQRIESALGVPLSQQSELARDKTASGVSPAARSAPGAPIESSTHKPAFAYELAQRVGAQRAAPLTETEVCSTSEHDPGISDKAAKPAPSTRMLLSQTGQLLQSLFEQFPKGAGPLTSAHPLFISAVMSLRAQALARALQEREIRERAPASRARSGQGEWVASNALSQALSRVLHQTIVQSGLFYEAQLVRALLGDKQDLQPLKEQPQAKAMAQIVKPGSCEAQGESAADLQTRTLVRQQLELLANDTIQWKGQAWPNVPMTWEIRPDSEAEWNNDRPLTESPSEESSRPWLSTIIIDLPKLGKIAIKIWLHGCKAKIALEPEQVQNDLPRHTHELHERLRRDAGLTDLQIVLNSESGEAHE